MGPPAISRSFAVGQTAKPQLEAGSIASAGFQRVRPQPSRLTATAERVHPPALSDRRHLPPGQRRLGPILRSPVQDIGLRLERQNVSVEGETE